MKQQITGFHTDGEGHWVAELDCGHGQHVRHDPPFMPRPWVTTAEGRGGRIGTTLNCVRCDDLGLRVASAVLAKCREALRAGYESAGVAGLCEEGRFEAAVGALAALDPREIAESALHEALPRLQNE